MPSSCSDQIRTLPKTVWHLLSPSYVIIDDGQPLVAADLVEQCREALRPVCPIAIVRAEHQKLRSLVPLAVQHYRPGLMRVFSSGSKSVTTRQEAWLMEVSFLFWERGSAQLASIRKFEQQVA